MKSLFIIAIMLIVCACKKSTSNNTSTKTTDNSYSISLELSRIASSGLDPVRARATLSNNGSPLTGRVLTVSASSGSVSAVTDNGDGTYDFILTPTATGKFPITVSYQNVSAKKTALVFSEVNSQLAQPQEVEGQVNTDGYEDGVTITPDGQYLFIQYGPIYFSGLFNLTSICPPSGGYTLYNIGDCHGNPDDDWIFNTIGPYNSTSRPNFPVGQISNNTLLHLNIVIANLVNKIALFPTVFYGFKRQSDGSYRNPFKVAFNDSKGANGPFGLSFKMTSANTADFVVAWNNYFNDLGDDKPDIYAGSLTMDQTTNLGNVVYSGDTYASITPNITPLSFTSHAGQQGNPHLHYDSSGNVISIWTDDEDSTHDLTVYKITSGTFPSGTWSKITLPSIINTTGDESQPFFTGTRLYMRRGDRIVYHNYIGSGFNDFNLTASWGAETVVLGGSATSDGEILTVGEPTIATISGKTYLYFVYAYVRATSTSTRKDIDLNAGFVEIQ